MDHSTVQTLVVELDLEKDTKTKKRYSTAEDDVAVDQLYVGKDQLAKIGNPPRIRVIIEAVR